MITMICIPKKDLCVLCSVLYGVVSASLGSARIVA